MTVYVIMRNAIPEAVAFNEAEAEAAVMKGRRESWADPRVQWYWKAFAPEGEGENQFKVRIDPDAAGSNTRAMIPYVEINGAPVYNVVEMSEDTGLGRMRDRFENRKPNPYTTVSLTFRVLRRNCEVIYD